MLSVREDADEEIFELLTRGSGDFKIERIVSKGHASAPDFWYEQDTTEWVVVLKGFGRLRFDEPSENVELNPGDWIEIPMGKRHRVEATSEDEETIWLAIHWKS